MGNYETLGPILGELPQNRLARQAVKSIALDAYSLERFWKRENAGDIRQTRVKCRVETPNLRNPWEMASRSRDDTERGWYMQWRERRRHLESPQRAFIENAMTSQVRPTMDNPVSNRIRRADFPIAK
jgi:hypothetical protein